MSQAIIVIRGLVKAYGYLPALRQLDLEIERGQFLALLGPNGSGKSTLLRLLAGLGRPTAGAIAIGGWSLPQEVAAVRAQLGLVSHKTLLYDNLTAYENLQFFAQMYALPPARQAERIPYLLERVGLHKRARDLVRTFSRGMQQRLSIARALLHEPAILLLDEPHTGLDQEAGHMLDALLLEAHGEGRTIVMATHHLDKAALAQRAVILARGRLVDDVPVSRDGRALAERYAQATAS